MVIEEVDKLKEGDIIFWASGREYFKGTFVKFVGNVTDLRLMLVRTDKGVEDEILHVFLTNEDAYNRETQKDIFKAQKVLAAKANKGIASIKTISVKSVLEKSEDIADEDDLSSAIGDFLENEIEVITKPKKLVSPSFVPTPLEKNNLEKVSGHRDYKGGPAPNLKTLQLLLKEDNIHIERDKAKWVRYHIVLADGTHEEIDFSGKVFELYNIYLDSGIDGILKLKK